ncbi:hypothetical protein MTBLM1_70051 [Rhodospirillaceae bacterium LM-1]|nr:hypothetical protein MTBLM1_70051 [Rhodospirillaceae bacterium LM-1]
MNFMEANLDIAKITRELLPALQDFSDRFDRVGSSTFVEEFSDLFRRQIEVQGTTMLIAYSKDPRVVSAHGTAKGLNGSARMPGAERRRLALRSVEPGSGGASPGSAEAGMIHGDKHFHRGRECFSVL